MESSTLQPGESIKPVVSSSQATKLILEHFGQTVTKIKELNSYDDKNFYVETTGVSDDGGDGRFIFKVLNSMDSRKTSHIETEHGIMFHLSSKGIKCPIPQKNLQGATFSLVQILSEDVQNANSSSSNLPPINLIRLLSFVEGEIMYEVPISTDLLYRMGAYIAQIENHLKELKYPALETFSSIWMLGHVTELDKFIFVIKDKPERFKLVSSVLDTYKSKVIPTLDKFETGVVHGDYNEQNILVQPDSQGDFEISGIIDFGDVHVAPYVFELAITICYMMLESVRCKIVEPFQSAGHVLAGYTQFRKVPEIELDVMRTLVACRLCQSLVIGAYSYSLDPGNEYLLTTAGRGWTLLDQIWNGKTDEEFKNICKQFLPLTK